MTHTDGPFSYFEDLYAGVTAAGIREDLRGPSQAASTLQDLATDLQGDVARVRTATEGSITAPVAQNPAVASASARGLAANGLYAVGLMASFAGDVERFDTTVDSINAEYQRRLRAATVAAHHDPDTRAGRIPFDRGAAGRSIEADLRPRWNAARRHLDDQADGVAARFRQGATDANVRGLVRAGLIPLGSAALYPQLTLTPQDTSAALAALEGPVGKTLRFLGILPPEDMALPGGIGWGAGLATFGFGSMASWISKGALGRWQPNFVLPNGMRQFQSLAPYRGWGPQAMWNRLKISVRPGAAELDFHGAPYQGASKAMWDSAGEWSTRAGGVVTGITSAWSQWDQDSHDPSLDTDDKVDRAATKGVASGAGAWAGAEGGAWVGGAIGTAICPGVGTVVGGAVGGLIGGAAGAWGGGAAADWINDKTDGIGHAVGDAAGWVGDKLHLW